MKARMLTVAPRYHGLVQPPGARMILTGPAATSGTWSAFGLLDDRTGEDSKAVDQSR
jgi:hypothetical protein